MPKAGPRRVNQYTREFKLAAVRLSQVSGLQVRAVAAALDVHPFMLSKWRKEVRDGTLRGRIAKAAAAGPAREIAQLQALERQHALLQEEHALLKKVLRFCASRKPTRSRSSTPKAPRSGSRGSADASA
jgi:transposase